MNFLDYNIFDFVRLNEQLDPRHANSIIQNKLKHLDDIQYERYINTYYMLKEVSKRLNDLNGYLSDLYDKEELERKMKTWTTDLYDKS